MQRADAYGALCRELEAWRRLPYAALLDQVGRVPTTKTVTIGEEQVTVSVRVRRPDTKSGHLRVEASADGPSCWRLERLEEAIVVAPPKAAAEAGR